MIPGPPLIYGIYEVDTVPLEAELECDLIITSFGLKLITALFLRNTFHLYSQPQSRSYDPKTPGQGKSILS